MKDLESLWISVLLPDHDGITIEMANQVVFLKENEQVKIPGFTMGEFLVFGEPTIERQTVRLRLVSEPSIACTMGVSFLSARGIKQPDVPFKQ